MIGLNFVQSLQMTRHYTCKAMRIKAMRTTFLEQHICLNSSMQGIWNENRPNIPDK
jgi:hypothetical protein